MAGSDALLRGASNSWSKSRKTTRDTRRPIRWSTASVPTKRSAYDPSSTRRSVSAVTSTTGRPASASSSSRTRFTPARRLRMRVLPQASQTMGRWAPSTGHRSSAKSTAPVPRSSTSAASWTSQRASTPHPSQASSRALPLRLRTHTSGSPSAPRNSGTSDGLNRPLRTTSSFRRSIRSITGHPSRSSDRDGTETRPGPAASRESTLGVAETSTQGTPARRARSMATSRAFQVGARSSR